MPRDNYWWGCPLCGVVSDSVPYGEHLRTACRVGKRAYPADVRVEPALAHPDPRMRYGKPITHWHQVEGTSAPLRPNP